MSRRKIGAATVLWATVTLFGGEARFCYGEFQTTVIGRHGISEKLWAMFTG
jgi:hypothetical protein